MTTPTGEGQVSLDGNFIITAISICSDFDTLIKIYFNAHSPEINWTGTASPFLVNINIFCDNYSDTYTILDGPGPALPQQQGEFEDQTNTQASGFQPFSSTGMFTCGHTYFL